MSACLDPGWSASPLPAARTYAWELWKGERNQLVDEGLRPPVDHSFGNRSGAFAIASSGVGAPRDEAVLVSEEIPRTSPQCDLELWYYMLGMLFVLVHNPFVDGLDLCSSFSAASAFVGVGVRYHKF